MFCTSGGNSASVMSMRFVFNFIFFFSRFYNFFFFWALTAFFSWVFILLLLLFLSPHLPFLPALFLFFLLLFPRPLCWAPLWSRRGISFHLDQSFCSSTATWMSWTEAGLGTIFFFFFKAEGAREIGAKERRIKSEARKSKLRRSFSACSVAANRRRQGES